MAEPAATPLHPLAGRGWSAGGLSVAPLPAQSRYLLRMRADAVEAASAALAIDLPTASCTSVRQGNRAALWLGPDEWLLLDGDPAAPPPQLAGPYALVDVSHRNCGFEVSGQHAADVLEHGCPLDLHLSAFPVGKCTRSLLGKVEILLWRTGDESFRIEFWRSFADYVTAFLARAARDHLSATDHFRPESFPIA